MVKNKKALSNSQLEILYDQLISDGSPFYNLGGVLEIDGAVDSGIFRNAISNLISSNPLLGSQIIKEGENHLFLEGVYPLQYFDETVAYAGFSISDLKRAFEADFSLAFNISSNAPMYKIVGIHLPGAFLLYIKFHHILIDGFGYGVFLSKLSAIYNELLKEEMPATAAEINSGDHIQKQEDHLQTAQYEADREYWKKYMETALGKGPQRLSSNKQGKDESDTSKIAVESITRNQLNATLKALKEQKINDFNYAMAVFALSLTQVFNLDTPSLIGYAIANRNSDEERQTIGHYTKILPVLIDPDTTATCEQLIRSIQDDRDRSHPHRSYPTSHIFRDNRRSSQNTDNLTDVTFSYLRQRHDHRYGEAGSRFDFIHQAHERTALSVYFFNNSDTGDVNISFSYLSRFFTDDQVNYLARVYGYHYLNVVKQLEWPTLQVLSGTKVLSQAEIQHLTLALNDNASLYQREKTIVDLFEEQVKNTPDNIAVVFEDNELTYAELNELSNRLASYLRKQYGIVPDDLVGIMLERSEWMIVAIFGVLKSGGAYVPIDPDYPQERIDFMIKDSGCRVLIDEREMESFKAEKADYDPSDHPVGLIPGNLLYCIYTSGSTGIPKGCLLEHGCVINLMKGRFLKTGKALYDFNATDVWTMFHSFSFDVSVWEMHGALLFGGKLVVVPKHTTRDTEAFLDLLTRHSATILCQTPSAFYNLMETESSRGAALGLRYIIFAGEALQPARLSGWKNKYKDTVLVNMYGITETTVHVTYREIGVEEIRSGVSDIGTAIPEMGLYIMDKYQNLVPYGVAGEIYVSGPGLARGYLNRPELTAAKFIENPYIPGQRIYRSGDLARWLPDGNMESLGRIDDQVKIRGYRIETGEIEALLLRHDEVTAAVVLAKQMGGAEKELIAYTTGAATSQTLRTYLRDRLPSYMVPGYYVQLESIPLTSNGKVNKRALPQPESSGLSAVSYIAPATETEKKLVRIWSEVLNTDEEKISAEADFFDLGGHSLKVIRLLGRIHQELGVKATISELFANSTLGLQGQLIASYNKKKYEPISIAPLQTDHELSAAQRRLWVLSRFDGAEKAYNIPVAMMLKGKPDLSAFEKAYQRITKRHEILRTVFREDATGSPRQHITGAEEYSLKINYLDISYDPTALDVVMAEQANYVFDLREPLLRCHLIKLGAERYVWLIVMHHIISDGWSMEVFTGEFIQFYNGCTKGLEIHLPQLSIQYKDYAAWHNRQLSSEGIDAHRSYWLEQFSGEIPVLELAADHVRPAVKTYNGASVTSVIENEVLAGFHTQSRETGGTLFMHLLACVNTLLYRYTGQEDIVLGAPASGREHPDLEGQIGYYINTLALRSQFDGRNSYEQLFSKVKDVALGAYEHQLYPYDHLVDSLQLRRDLSRNPLFDVMVVLQDAAQQGAKHELSGLAATPFEIPGVKVAKFDLSLVFTVVNDSLSICIEYNTDIYSRERIESMISHLKSIMSSVAKDARQQLSDIPMLAAAEQQYLLHELNNTVSDHPANKTIVELFEEQVRETPDNMAVIFEDRQMSYLELNRMSNRLAAYLRLKYDIRPDDLIGIKLNRSEWMIVAMLGVLKSGGAYVPVDPDYPRERADLMIKDSGCRVVIDEAELDIFREAKTNYEDTDQPAGIDPGNLVYCIYTSGSTGVPKGVLVEHRGLVNLALAQKKKFNVTPDERILQIASLSFDPSAGQMCLALLSGAALVVVTKAMLVDIHALEQYMLDQEITHIDAVASLLSLIEGKNLVSLKRVLSGGEICSVDLANKWKHRCDFYNVYGPTETTVITVEMHVKATDEYVATIPIGRPVSNTEMFILDARQVLVPYCIPGELCIGGAGLARGYLNRPELTAEKFIENPYLQGRKLYRTGDMARWLPDGNLEYLGRIDEQVKIRGYRIETGEIEAVLRSHHEVSAAVVVARHVGGADKELVAYTTGTATGEDLKGYLLERLPAHMIPASFVHLDHIPLTSNGKVNSKALPIPDDSGILPVAYAAPSTETERALVNIWSEVLNKDKEKISINADFFDLGGHSLKVIRLLGSLHKELGVKLALSELFSCSTVALQAALVASKSSKHYEPIRVTAPQTEYELSAAQRRLWVINRFEGAGQAYNIPVATLLNGAINKQAFEAAYQHIIARHEILRTVFTEDEAGNPRQMVLDIAEHPFEVTYKEMTGDLPDLTALIAAESSYIFDIREPLVQCHLIKLGADRHLWLIVMHHIISDAWSMNVFMREFHTLYNSYAFDKEVQLPALRIQYKDYAAWHHMQLSSGDMVHHSRYWQERFAGEIPVLELSPDLPRPEVKTYNGATVSIVTGSDVIPGLNRQNRENGGTIFMHVLSCVYTLLYRYTGQEDIVLGAPASGREHPDLEGQLGYYINTLALRTQFNGRESYGHLFNKVREVALGAYEHQLYPYDHLVDSLQLKRNLSRNPLFDVMVVLQDAEQQGAGTVLSGLESVPCDIGAGNVSKFDMTFSFKQTGKSLTVTLEYNTDIYSHARAASMLGHLKAIMESVATSPQKKLCAINMLSGKEEQYLLKDLNDTASVYPREKTIVDLFEEQVCATPEHTAVVFENRELSYAELNSMSNRFAAYLRHNYDIKPDDLVGITLGRSEWMIVAILGVLKSGGAYVPIDPEYPQERINFMVKDSGCKVLIDEAELEAFKKSKEDHLAVNTPVGLLPKHLVHCIYTSGSTGIPKGVLTEHRGLVNFSVAQIREFGMTATERTLQLSSISFDASAEQIWITLLSGAALIIVGKEQLADVQRLEHFIVAQKITYIHAVPSLLNVLEITDLSNLKRVMSAGEACTLAIVEKWKDKCTLYNGYGPTETTVIAVELKVDATTRYSSVIPIGRPMSNTQILLLDDQRNLVPFGIPGELCIGGDGLARGYLNRAELTAEKFIEHPYTPGGRIYRSGDLARWLPDGSLEYLGRMDDQVKIRGYRIETGEIEAVLLEHEQVHAAVVVARQMGGPEKELIAYTTGIAATESLRAHLHDRLPSHMVPGYYVHLENIPLNSNGKVNRKVLPLPEGTGFSAVGYVAPTSETEKILTGIWSGILGIPEDKISITGNFFDLGGHSLKAIRLLGIIHKKLGVKLTIAQLFANSNIAEQGQLIDGDLLKNYEPIAVTNEQPDHELSAAQRRLWIMSRFEGAAQAYNVPVAIYLDGPLNKPAFERAHLHIIERHEILRTVFIEDAMGQPRQKVLNVQEYPFAIAYKDMTGDPTGINAIVAEQVGHAFDLGTPLLCSTLVALAADRHLWIMVMHHIICDEWSMGVFAREFNSLYNGYAGGQEVLLPSLRVQYKDYSAWHNKQLSSGAATPHRNYLLEHFSGELPVLELAPDRPRPAIKTYNGATVSNIISLEILSGLTSQSKEWGGTLFIHLISCVHTLLSRYTGQEDIVLGAPASGRDHNDLEGQMGYYVNTLALRTRFSITGTYRELYEEAKEVALCAYEHQAYPFDHLVDALNVKRDPGRNPLFDVMIVLQDAQDDEAKFQLDELKLAAFPFTDYNIAKFDFTFSFRQTSQGLSVSLEYNNDIYSEARAEGMLAHLKQIAISVSADPKQRLCDIIMMTGSEERYQLNNLNNTYAEYPQDETIVDLFEEQVQKTPHNIAVVFEDRSLSYLELNQMSNRLAAYLTETYSIMPDELVGIMLDRSEWMIVAILGILKSGGAYVPIDPEYPDERIDLLVNDSRCRVLIDKQELAIFNSAKSRFADTDTSAGLGHKHLAYCIYTSGSTGHPKGVLIEHGGLVSLTVSQKNELGVTAGERALLLTSISFDASVEQIWITLVSGAALVIAGKELLSDIQALGIYIEQQNITSIVSVASLLNLLEIQDFTHIKRVISGGEFCSPALVNKWKNKCAFYNEYGPTETTVTAVKMRVDPNADYGDSIPIGKPIANVQAYLLDLHSNLVPYGLPGELCIGGAGLARGYLNRAELTAEKFIEHPYMPGERIYRTGDLARWLPDGNLEYLGRADDQVKIRGHRIETGEIEALLSQHPQVSAAVVIARQMGNAEKELIAYTTGAAAAESLRAHLKQRLPAYMVPGYYVRLESIPVTGNGKVDRKALPLPEGSGLASVAYIAPATAAERALLKIWSEVLNAAEDKISVEADFFDLGGHSLKAIRLLGLIHREMGVKLSLSELFACSTIAAQAQLALSKGSKVYEPIAPAGWQPDYDLSAAQRRLWVLSRFEGAGQAYNIPMAMTLDGPLNRQAFERAYEHITERHQIFRTVFTEDAKGNPRQQVLDMQDFEFSVEYSEIINDPATLNMLVAEATAQVFDLRDPLLRCLLVKTGLDQHTWIMVLHHIISDGWSMGVFAREFSSLYNNYAYGSEMLLPSLNIQYKDYAAWHNEQLSSKGMDAHRQYWKKQFSGEIPVLELAADHVRPAVKSYNGASVTSVIENEVLAGFHTQSRETGGTLFMHLLACVNTLLYRYTGQEDIVLGAPASGREHPDLEGQIGYYINTLALRSQFDGRHSYEQLFSKVKDVALGAYEHQLYPYDELVDILKLRTDMSRNPLFDVMIALQDGEQQGLGLQLSGLNIAETPIAGYNVAKFDLTFSFVQNEKGLLVNLEYNTDIYSNTFAGNMLVHLERIAAAVASNPAQTLNNIRLLTPEEEQFLLEGLNNTTAEYPRDKTIVDLFEEQVQKTPHNIAVVFEDRSISYLELNQMSNRLATYLNRTYDIRPDDLIGICLDRSEWMIVAILGILKSGAAYVPIDPEYPRERIDLIIKDSGCRVMIDEAGIAVFEKEKDNYSDTNTTTGLTPHNLVYCIYTSGSTGTPKGILVEHGGLVNIISAYFKGEIKAASLTCNFVFDVSVLEIFSAICSGAKLVIPKKGISNTPVDYLAFLNANDIDTVYIHPFQLSYFSSAIANGTGKYLRNILVGVEPIDHHLVLPLLENNIRVLNGYGPTETTVCATFHEVGNPVLEHHQNIPIGKPIANVQAYLLDLHNNLVPYGLPGELCIGGAGLARGYLNRAELTAEKFIEHPYMPGERIYRTGDLARWLPDGNLEYLGRADDQVKIRGHRIETGEIEALLSQHAQVSAAVVIARQMGNAEKELIAYTTGAAAAESLRAHLKQRLPAYMVPGYYVRLESIPVTGNGKVDRKALPLPEGSGLASVAYIAPATAAERALLKIWSEVLNAAEDKISVEADFFDLGGHSLKAIRLLGLIHREMGVKLSLSELFACSTIAAQAQLALSKGSKVYEPIAPAGWQPDYDLSAAQRRLWVLSRFEGAGQAYNIPMAMTLDGPLNRQAFERAYEHITERHQIFRTVFTEDAKGNPRQQVLDMQDFEFSVEYSEIINDPATLNMLVAEATAQVFDLRDPLLRCLLIKTGLDQHTWIMVLHHIISDGWSMGVFAKEFSSLYNNYAYGSEMLLPSLNIQYKDYAAWHNEQLSSKGMDAHRQYWKEQFSGEIPVLELAADHVRPAVKTYNGASVTAVIGNEVLAGFNTQSRETGGTLFMHLLACVNTLLYRYTGQEDIVLGAPASGREHPDLEGQIGYYINTLALRSQFDGRHSYEQLFSKVKDVALGAYEHQLYPYDELVDILKLRTDMSRNPLFDVMIALQDGEQQGLGLQLSGLNIAETPIAGYNVAKFDLTFSFVQNEKGLLVNLEYNTDIYSNTFAGNMLVHLERIAAAVASNPAQTLNNIRLLTPEEEQFLLEGLNNTTAEYPRDKTIVDLFEEQVQKTPHNIAVVFEDRSISYLELNQMSNRLATYLTRTYDIRPDDLIGICLDRSEWMIVAILGVLKSGAAYVPVDPEYPRERIDLIIKDSGCRVMIDEAGIAVFEKEKENYSNTNTTTGLTPHNLVYCIYTSGSTGTPKGIIIEHKGLVNLAVAQIREFGITEDERILQLSSISFDASAEQIWIALLTGAALVVPGKELIKDAMALGEYISAQKITHVHTVPSLLDLLEVNDHKHLKRVISGGDICTVSVADKWKNTCDFYNEYGPTETTITCVEFKVAKDAHYHGSVPVGKPVANTRLLILDKYGNLVPFGIPGELWIGGEGLARGYLNRAALTAEKFIDNPFKAGDRIYRSGDMAKWLPDGNLGYLGRLDDQVKIRGYRIELGEIEHVLSGLSGIDKSCVVVKERRTETGTNRYLVGYYVPDNNGPAPEADSILQTLSQLLPEYMVPAALVSMESFPLTVNGKLDKKGLPEPGFADTATKYQAPANKREAELCKIWQEVLGLEQVGVTDDFFSIGGNSILAIQASHRMSREFGCTVKVGDLFRSRTIKGLRDNVITDNNIEVKKTMFTF